MQAAIAISGPAVTLRALRLFRPDPLSVGHAAAVSGSRSPSEAGNDRQRNDRGEAGSLGPGAEIGCFIPHGFLPRGYVRCVAKF